MPTPPASPTPALALTDEQLWDDPYANYDATFDALHEREYEGVLLAAPSEVPLDTRATLPVLALHAGSLAELRGSGFTRNAALVAVDLDRNRVYARRAIELPPPPAGKLPPPPTGYAVVPSLLEARERLALEWQPARLLLRVLLRERVSDSVELRLGKSSEAYEDPEVAAYIARARARQQPRAVEPGEGSRLPRYYPDASASEEAGAWPERPAGLGLSLSAPRVVPLERGARCVVRGRVRVEPLGQERLEPDVLPEGLRARVDAAGTRTAVGGRPSPAAVVTVTLVLFAADDARVVSETLRVPVWREGDDAACVGDFEFDLFAVLPDLLRLRAQSWFVRGFCGPHMSDCALIGLLQVQQIL